jgi:hypothetical protein
MENNNLNSTNKPVLPAENQTPQVPVSAPSAIEQDFLQIKALVQKVKTGIKEKRAISAQPGAKTGPVNQKLLLIIGGVFVISLLLLLVTAIAKPRRSSQQVTAPTPTPVVSQIGPSMEVTNPSRYATDAGVIKLEEEIKNLDREMVETSIKEVDLVPPTLDWDVNFKK